MTKEKKSNRIVQMNGEIMPEVPGAEYGGTWPKSEEKRTKPIERQSKIAWWCPFCDHAMQIKLK